MKRATIVLGLALGGAALAWAGSQGNDPSTPMAVGDVSSTVTLTATAQSIHFTNDGANPAIVRVFVTCETIAAIVATDTKARLIKPGEPWGLEFGPREASTACSPTAASGYGYIGFAVIDSGAGLTTTLRWFAK